MSILTPDLQKKFEQVAILKKSLSKASQQVFDHAMYVTARYMQQPISSDQLTLDAKLKKSLSQLENKLKKEPDFKTLIANMTQQANTSTASAVLKGLNDWIISPLQLEKDCIQASPPQK